MTEKCNQCGSCCRSLVINVSPQEITREVLRRYPFVDWDKYSFMKDDYALIFQMKPLTREQALKINPCLEEYLKGNERQYIYKCPFIGPDNKCTVHDELKKNGMCDGYPWYGKKPYKMKLYAPNCGYREDWKNAKRNLEAN